MSKPIKRFRPTFWATFFTVPVLCLLIGLGIWQCYRLQWKLGLLATIDARMHSQPMALPAEIVPPVEQWDFQPVSVSGHFDNAHELYLTGRSYQGASGYNVITPLTLDDGRTAFVNRGWVPYAMRDPATRKDGLVEGETQLVAVARVPGAKGWMQPENDVAKNVWFHADLAEMAGAVGAVRFVPLLLEQRPDPAEPAGPYPRPISTATNINNPHLQYAVTWFAFALTLAVIYFLYHWRPEEEPADKAQE